MSTDYLQAQAHERAQELPGAELTHPFGEDWDVWKVRDKVFMLQTQVTGDPMVILKVDPFDSRALQSTYPNITPGYHMNKKHWITIKPAEDFPTDLLIDLVTESYLLVVEKLPKRLHPVDIATFGRPDAETPSHPEGEREGAKR